MMFTILGGDGFVGRNLAQTLRDAGHDVTTLGRADIQRGIPPDRDLGHLIYAIGLTADFRTRLPETVEAHAGLVARLLDGCRWQSWLYLSSTRVYGARQEGLCSEADSISLYPSADSVYDLSKLLGEALCMARPEQTCRVARLSNIFGAGMNDKNFLGSLEAATRHGGAVTIGEDRGSAKDYLSIGRACTLLMQIALGGTDRIYNVAGGQSVDHATIAGLLEKTRGATVDFAPNGALRRLADIDTKRANDAFGTSTTTIENDIETFLIEQNQQE